MSYLNDDPLSFEEEQAIHSAELSYALESIPRSLRPQFNTGSVNDNGNHFLPTLQNDYIKIDIRRNHSHTFIINSQTHQRLFELIHSRFGLRPLNNYIVCNSITIVPCPDQICSLYYHAGQYDEAEHPKFKLIGSFLAPHKPVKYSIPCPYSDSKYGGDKCIFNWLRNNSVGDVMPSSKISSYTLRDNNTTMGWIQPEPLGAFMITGITDAIGFHCSFILNDNFPYRQGPRYTRYYVPRQRIGGDRPGEVGYEIPSQEFYQDEAQEDPLLVALRH